MFMLLNNMIVRYDGIHPTVLLQNRIAVMVQEILNEAPEQAFAEATFTQKNNIVKGFIHVNSAAGPFFAMATGTESSDVCHKLLVNMRRRFNKWKVKRFSRPIFQNNFVLTKVSSSVNHL